MLQRPSQRHRTGDTDRPGPPWQLLIESADPVLEVADFVAFREAGFDVTLCQGPSEQATECPLVRGEPCPYAAAADVVLFDVDDPAKRLPVLWALHASRPELPIVVRPPKADPPIGGYPSVSRTTSVAGQVSTLREAALQSARQAV
jgi:hypothetical protein